MARKSGIISKATNMTLTDVGHSLSRLVYKAARPAAIAQLARELQAPNPTVEAIQKIMQQKDYSEIGQTEVQALMGSQFSDQPPENLQLLASLYTTHPWVFICASYIATAMSGMNLRVMRATGFEDGREILEGADDSPVGRMFRWVNPHQSHSEFIEALVSWYLLTGEAYVAFTAPGPDTPRGIPAEMYVLFSPFVSKVVSPTRGLLGFEYNISGETAFFHREDVFYMKSFSPVGRFRGQGIPEAGYKTIATDQQLRQFNRNVLSQGVHMSGILETENVDLNPDDASMIRDSFNKQYAGSKAAGKVAVLWGGLKFNPQTIMQKDVMMDTQLVAHRDEIISSFGLKPELLTEKFANKATAETVRRMAYEDVIIGRYGRRIESVWSSTGLMRFDPDLRARFDTRDVPALQTSQKELISSGALAISSGQMTINEVRDNLLHLPAIDGIEADTLLIGNQPVANVLTDPGAGPDSGKTRMLPPAGTALAKSLVWSESQNIVVKAVESEFQVVFSRTRKTAQDRLERNLRSIYRELQTEATGLVGSRSTVDGQIMAQLEQMMFYDGKRAIVSDVADAVKYAAGKSIDANLALLKIETAFDVKPIRALGRLVQQEQRVRNMMGKSWTGLRGSLRDGMARGETQSELVGRTNRHFEGLKNNAETVARTEVLPAVNGAAVDVAVSAIEAGVDVVSIWSTAQDELVRQPPKSSKNHALAHGLEIIPGQEMFLVSGEKMEYPGDSWNGASADNTINCRCGVRNEVRLPGESEKQ